MYQYNSNLFNKGDIMELLFTGEKRNFISYQRAWLEYNYLNITSLSNIIHKARAVFCCTQPYHSPRQGNLLQN